MGIRLGICGVGRFSTCFIPLFKHHPEVENVVLCDLVPEKLEEQSKRFDCPDTCGSLDELCAMDVDAVALITQQHLHGPQAIQALEAGKHVYSAVPSASAVDDLQRLVRTVEETGRIYMVGETSYYYPCALYCRKRAEEGAFGHVVYSEAEYYHDFSHGLYEVKKQRHGAEWKRYANFPPMYYPTHSVSMVVSSTGARVTHVSCMGFEDRVDDGVFHGPDKVFNNTFSNQSMLCRMSDGSMARFNEFRRVGHPGTVGMSMYGTEGSYEEQHSSKAWVTKDRSAMTELTEELRCQDLPAEGGMAVVTGADGTHHGVSRIHPVHLLPKEFLGLPNGHAGSHQFLVHDFVTACTSGKTPPNNVWDAAKYLLPGLVGHESSLRGGELLEVPHFGDGPAAGQG
jgi:predicted dehydrogenase